MGHRLRRIGACNPQGLDLPIGCGLKHVYRGFARPLGHMIHAPQGGDFGAMLWVGQVAVRREQIGHAAHLAATHGIGLTCE